MKTPRVVQATPKMDRTGKERRRRRTHRLVAGIAVVATLFSLAPVPARAATQPPSRMFSTIAADPATGKLVLFGGLSKEGTLYDQFYDDTWLWNGTAWKNIFSLTRPRPRTYAAMAADPATRTIVLFGGLVMPVNQATQSALANDTWVWDGTAKTWAQQLPPLSPSPREGAAMSSDSATGTVVLFGGDAFGETWTWNGTTRSWTLENPPNSPPPRAFATMAYDKRHKKVVLFGGSSAGPINGTSLGDTWTWDGASKTWTEHIPAAAPPPRTFASSTYDGYRKEVVLFGGMVNNVEANDTWTWDGTTWSQQAPVSSPPPRAAGALGYHPATQKSVLFGGTTEGGSFSVSETWTYATTWKRRL